MTAPSTVLTDRPILLTREGSVFRLAFRYHPDLVSRVKTLPYAEFDRDVTKTWTALVCAQSVQTLRSMFYDGLVDVPVDTLLAPGEAPAPTAPAILRAGTTRRPFYAHLAVRGDDNTYNRLKSIPGGQWEKNAGALSYPPSAAVALAELVDRGVLTDPDALLSPAGVVVAFDGRTGDFVVRGDERAAHAFARNFPHKDVVTAWQERALDVAFGDDFSAEMYRGELARHGEGFQPDGLLVNLYPFQRQAVAMGLERTGLGIFLEPGLGKCLHPDTLVWTARGPLPIEQLWRERASAQRTFDGTGMWATTAGELTVTSVHADGHLQQGAVPRMYRQKVREQMRRVTLADGSVLTLTAAHKLLTAGAGWTTAFAVGDTVAVAARLPGTGTALTGEQVTAAAQAAAADRTALLPEQVMGADAPSVAAFLAALLGRCHHAGRVEHTVELRAASRLRLAQLNMLLRRVGITLTVDEVPGVDGSFGGHLTGPALAAFTTLLATGQVPSATDDVTGGAAGAEDVRWVAITDLEAVAYDGFVYDLEVDVHHNFVAEGVLCHNTAVAIATGMELLRQRKVTRVVAMVPAAIRTQWKQEIIKFTGADPDDIVIVKGTPKQRAEAYEKAKDARWFIVHYDILTRDKKDLKALFNGALVVADEAHRLKTWSSGRSQSAKELCRGSARRLALTGTPVESNVGEWFEVIGGFTLPGALGSPSDFNARYRFPGQWGGWAGARNLGELRDRSRAYYLRKTKRDVAKHLPPLIVQTTVLDPEPAYAAVLRRAHREAADEIKAAALDRLERSGGRSRPGQLTLLDSELADEVETGAEMTAVGMLRLLCSSPRLVAESDSAAAAALREAGIIPEEDGPKVDELRTIGAELLTAQQRRKAEMAESGTTSATPAMVTGERVVIFTFSKRMATLIADRFTEDGIPYVTFTGDTGSDERDEAVAKFTDPDSDVIAFIATDAAAEGLNLGRCASTLVNADLSWTASRMWQRAQRIHRLDGTAPSYRVINLTLANTMEVGVAKLLDQRADLSDALLGEQGGRNLTTGRRGRSIFEEAMDGFDAQLPAQRARAAAAAPAAAVAARQNSSTGRRGGAAAAAEPARTQRASSPGRSAPRRPPQLTALRPDEPLPPEAWVTEPPPEDEFPPEDVAPWSSDDLPADENGQLFLGSWHAIH